MRCTIKDVARVAGVSLGTASNVINNLHTVSPENRKRVLQAIKDLNYNPNHAARTLKTRRSKSIGLIIPDISNPFYPEFARGVEDAASDAGYNLFLCNSDRNINKERSYLHALMEKTVEGLILYKPQLLTDEIMQYRQQCPLVLVDTEEAYDTSCDVFNVDDYAGVWQALHFLWEKKHRRIALIAGLWDSASAQNRIRAFQDFFNQKQYPLSQGLIQQGHYDWHSGYDCANHLLRRMEPPTAILAANDLMAIGALKAAQERGLSVPGDLSVMGYDDIDMAALCTPALTTVRQPKYRMGEACVRALIKRLEDRENADRSGVVTTMKTDIVVRGTVAECNNQKA
jgi:DNA-binding LacI/PurR family transcriptional regulator